MLPQTSREIIMQTSYLLTLVVVIGLAATTTAVLKADECEGEHIDQDSGVSSQGKLINLFSCLTVCIKTINKFADTLTEAQKKDPKLIEAEFKTFCKVQKNKENRFVSVRIGRLTR